MQTITYNFYIIYSAVHPMKYVESDVMGYNLDKMFECACLKIAVSGRSKQASISACVHCSYTSMGFYSGCPNDPRPSYNHHTAGNFRGRKKFHEFCSFVAVREGFLRKIWGCGVLWHGMSEQSTKIFSTKIAFFTNL